MVLPVIFFFLFKKEKQAAHFSCCRMWSQVRKGDGENFPVHFVYSCAALQVPVQPAPISPLPLQCAAPVCRLPGCGSDLSGHGLHSARTRRRRRRREVQQKERPDYPRSLQHVEVRQTHFFFFCFLRKFQLINFSFWLVSVLLWGETAGRFQECLGLSPCDLQHGGKQT